MLRLLHVMLVMGLVGSAAYVFDIKYSATAESQQAQKLRNEISRERDLIANARAEWGKLSSPDRIQALAERYLKMKPAEPWRFGWIATLPERPKPADPIGDILQTLPDEAPTGSVQQ